MLINFRLSLLNGHNLLTSLKRGIWKVTFFDFTLLIFVNKGEKRLNYRN